MRKDLLDYPERAVLITAAATGIGRANAIAFAEQGARVVVSDVGDDALETVFELERPGAEAMFIRTDVSDPPSVKALVRSTADGRLVLGACQ